MDIQPDTLNIDPDLIEQLLANDDSARAGVRRRILERPDQLCGTHRAREAAAVRDAPPVVVQPRPGRCVPRGYASRCWSRWPPPRW